MNIKVERLSFGYQGSARKALNDVTLEASGELVFVVGGNGSGKSTLLSCIAGLAPGLVEGQIEGFIEINGVKITDYAGKVPVGLVLQDSDTYLFEEVAEEIAYPLLNSGFSPEEAQKKISPVAKLLKLEHLLHRKLSSLSGGERQKVAVAAALVTDAPGLLLDDPVEQLDPAAAHELLVFLKNLADHGKSIIVTARKLTYAVGYADRIIFLKNGSVVPNESRHGDSADFTFSRDDIKPALGQTHAGGRPGLPVLDFSRLSHRFATGGGIEDIDLTVESGEILAVMGPNGAGKSTLIKHCLRLLAPQEGTGFVFGEDITKAKTWQLAKRVGMLFQNPDDQIFNETVEKEVAWGLKIKGSTWEQAVVKARNVLAQLDLREAAGKHPHSLPQFQRQLIALAGVLAAEPELIILDEPTKTLDEELILKVMNLILERRSQGATVIIITHDPVIAWHFTDRTALLVGGRLIGLGQTREVLLDKTLTRQANLSSHPFVAALETLQRF